MARKLNCSVGPSILVRSQYHLAVPVLASVSISAGPQHCIVLPNLHHITLYCIAQPVSCFIVLYCPTCICCRGLWANWIWPLAICARGVCAWGKFYDKATALQEYQNRLNIIYKNTNDWFYLLAICETDISRNFVTSEYEGHIWNHDLARAVFILYSSNFG